ncbi:OsmC family peroxiredoxin [Halomarina halobia]|uniref:OsmC family peroxiredoxin n=1 Tax=Halomarina halobia TaxID=3033386 RepID=A0ABD6A8A8_9EURY|nr:OsmC family peroxiredoxin [Halomarina sp. PSR21]
MPVRTSEATWRGDLRDGDGDFVVGDDVFEGEFTFVSRFQEGEEGKTNPEELIGAAHASCFSMALANGLAQDEYDPERIHTTASVHLEDGAITRIELDVEAEIPEIDDETFQEYVSEAKSGCPVSQALSAVEIEANATLA